MKEEPAIAMQSVRGVLVAAAARGADSAAIARAAGISEEQLAELDGRVPISTGVALFREVERATGDKDFGLHLAELSKFVPFDAVHYVGRMCTDLRGVFRVATRYTRLINTLADPELVEEGDIARYIHRIRSPESPSRAAVECALAILFIRPRAVTGPAFSLREVTFRHAKPESTAEHTRIFEAPVRFGCEENALVFDRAMLELRPEQSASDPQLHAILQRYIDDLLAKLPPADNMMERVRRVIADSLSGENVGIEDVAAKLHVSPRSLQRRLNEEGTSFSDLVRDLRRDLAASYLRERRVPIAEVAFLLGFAEASSFHRAFKSWFGVTPQEFRKRNQPGFG